MVKVWRLGNFDKGIIPSKEAVDKLKDILGRDTDFNIVWGEDLEMEVFPETITKKTVIVEKETRDKDGNVNLERTETIYEYQ